MPTDHRAALAKIKRFDQLVAYLRDEMGWPIAKDSFENVDDLFYEFTADELGIDPKTAAKIVEIKRLRPLSTKQPWGIFFVKFEPKKLPVVALRRILSQVALKKRPSANSAERAVWAAEDLLFVSNYGEGDERQISFAHFSKSSDDLDLPTLKVLGWDNLDTALHLDDVARELTEHLSWPDDDADVEAWRNQWRAAFTLRHREVIATSKDLSIRLAELARAIHDRIKTALAIETERGPLTKLMNAFQEALVHDLDADGFADMYAQTIAYGLLSARIVDPQKKTADDLASHMRTSPFLRELMETFLKVGGRRGKAGGPGIDFDELGVSEVVGLLDHANMEAVVRDFGDKNRQEDPVIHFYELFLHSYNKQLKIQRGVFYTPQPVVSYIVRSVHELLQTEFGLADGLADTTTWGEMLKKHVGLKLPLLTDEPGEKRTISPDEPFVQILDPATGTATFLVEVIDVIHRTLAAKWKQQRLTGVQQVAAWNVYVPKHLLPRLHAFELMMAPYAIAHMKIGLKLAETGYRFGTEERARIYLTNALEPWVKQLPLIGFDALAHEAAAVNEIKRHKRFTVVIGNPPYSNFGQLNRIPFILDLLDDYKRGLNERKINLDDDFIKFIRYSQHALSQTGVGLLGFITNNTYLDGLTHRRMRQSLREAFSKIWVLDLHGSLMKGDVCPDGSIDENVFDIKQGVSVGLLCASPRNQSSSVLHHELWGTRSAKYSELTEAAIRTTEWSPLPGGPPNFFFVGKALCAASEYEAWPSISDVFIESVSGIQSGRDSFVSCESNADFDERIAELKDESLSDAEIGKRYELPVFSGFDLRAVRRALRADKTNKEFVRLWLYRPFDVRRILFHDNSIKRKRGTVMKSLLKPNLALISVRQLAKTGFSHVFVTRHMGDGNTISLNTREYNYYFPLHIYQDEDEDQRMLGIHPTLNLSHKILTQIRGLLGSKADVARGLTPEDIFHYAYAVFHSPGYRSRYAEFLKIDFPRLPLTGNLELFRALARLGGELVALHLMESAKLDNFITAYTGPKNPEVERVGWSDDTVWLDAAATKKGQPATPGTVGFRGVPAEVWNFHIGGYQVCHKWLKDRKARKLLKADIEHYKKILVALAETIRSMKEIDEVIEKHGGWPGAFRVANVDAVPAVPEVEGNVAVIQSAKQVRSVDTVNESLQLFEAAESAPPTYSKDAGRLSSSGRAAADEPDREELMCAIRQLFSDGQSRGREEAIKDLSRQLGHERVGPRIGEELSNALRTAVRRGILSNNNDTLELMVRAISDYKRDFLKDQFLASLQGRSWEERDTAIRNFARWLGFSRTGPVVDKTTRSLISGLLRENKLESDGLLIRRC